MFLCARWKGADAMRMFDATKNSISAFFSVTDQKTVSGLFSFFFLKVLFPKLKSQHRVEYNVASSTVLSDSRCFKNWTRNKKMFPFPSFIQAIPLCCHPFPILLSLIPKKPMLPVFWVRFDHGIVKKKKELQKKLPPSWNIRLHEYGTKIVWKKAARSGRSISSL